VPSRSKPPDAARRPPRAIVLVYGGALRAPVQRSHHLARHFAERVPVVYAPYRSPVELLQGDARMPVWPPLAAHPRVFPVALPPTTFLSRRSRRAAVLHGFVTAAAIARALRPLRVMPNEVLLFLELATALPVIDHFPHARVAYDCVDDFRHWPGASARMGRLYADMEETLAQRAEWIIASTPHWLDRFADSKARKIIGLNGAEFEAFASSSCPPPGVEPDDLAGIPRPRLLYLGVGSSYVDAEVLRALSQAALGSVVVVGPIDRRAAIASRPPMTNVFWLGRKSYEALPAYVHASDVALIPATDHPSSDRIPSKLFMYCAAGVPVVARRCSSLEPYADRILLAGSAAEFVEHTAEALRHPEWKRDDRVALARENTWQNLSGMLLREFGIA